MHDVCTAWARDLVRDSGGRQRPLTRLKNNGVRCCRKEGELSKRSRLSYANIYTHTLLHRQGMDIEFAGNRISQFQ